MDKFMVNIVTDLKIATNGAFFQRGYNPINEVEAAYFETTGNRVYKNGSILSIKGKTLKERLALREKAFPSTKVEADEVVTDVVADEVVTDVVEKDIEALQKEYAEVLEKEAPARYKNDAEWLSKKIAETK